jgi:hypothetical protein
MRTLRVARWRWAIVAAVLVGDLAACATPPSPPVPNGTASQTVTASTPSSPPADSPSATPAPTPAPSRTGLPVAAPVRRWFDVAVGDNGGTDRLGPGAMLAVAALANGFIAVGSGPTGGLDWTSPDGSSWSRTEFPSRVLANAQPVSLAVGTNLIVAAGSYTSVTGTRRPAMWATAAGPEPALVGGSWSLVLDPAGGTSEAAGAADVGSMAGVVAAAGGFVAVGTIAGVGYAWRSSDGSTWSAPIPLPGAIGADLWRLVIGPGGIVASGETYGASGWQSMTWRSTDDGTTWIEAAFPMANLDTIAADQDAYWAFGWDPDAAGNDAAAHTVFRSTDGATWSRVGILPPGTASVATAIGGPSDVTLIVVMSADAATGRAGAIYSTTEPDRTWTKEGPADASARDPANASALLPTSGSLLAIGAAGDRPAAWQALPAAAAPPAAPVPPVANGGCPTGRLDLSAILALEPAQRLSCFGGRAIKVTAFVARPEGLGGTCDCTATPAWLTGGGLGYPAAWLVPFAAPFGQVDSLPAFARPSVKGATTTLRWVSVTGHFDDPASSTCRVRNSDGSLRDSAAESVQRCRQNFVVTTVTTVAPPDPSADLRIGQPYVIEPDDGGIDTPPADVTALGIVDAWMHDAPVATILVFRTALSAAGTKAFNDRQAGSLIGKTVSTIGGVRVATSADGSTAVFSIGHRTFRISTMTADGSSTPAGTIRAIAASIIAADR